MKKTILSILVTLTAMVGSAQNYEAANWKILLLDNPQQITIPAPPETVQ